METSQAIPPAFLAERERQVSGEGYDSRHDDEHIDGELLAVARMYYQRAIGMALPMRDTWDRGDRKPVPVGFPWEPKWWKPKTPQRDLERAGALCLAELDRLKRAGRESVGHVDEQLGAIAAAYQVLPQWL